MTLSRTVLFALCIVTIRVSFVVNSYRVICNEVVPVSIQPDCVAAIAAYRDDRILYNRIIGRFVEHNAMRL